MTTDQTGVLPSVFSGQDALFTNSCVPGSFRRSRTLSVPYLWFFSHDCQ